MNFEDCIFDATQRALDMDGLPDSLLPLIIFSEVAALAGPDGGPLAGAGWCE